MNNFRRNKLYVACMNALVVSTFSSTVALAQAEQEAALEEVVVTGIRTSLKESIDRKRDGSSILDAIVSSDIGKMPDRNIAEAMQRIPGVTINREDGEGTSITIRGLTDNLNVTTINGQTVASAGDGRGIDFSSMPSSMVQAIEVYKTPMASHIEGSLGGLVNLVTIRPLDVGETKGAAFVEGVYSDLSEESDPAFSVSYTTAISDTFGIAAALSHEKRTTVTDSQTNWNWHEGFHPDTGASMGWYPENYAVGRQISDRERDSLIVNFQWQPAENINIFLDTNYSSLEVEEEAHTFGGHLWGFDGNEVNLDSVVTNPETNTITEMEIDRWFIDPSDEVVEESVDTLTLQLGGDVELGDLTLSAAVGYSEAETDKLTQRIYTIDHWYLNDDKHDGMYRIGSDRQFEYLEAGEDFYDPTSSTNHVGDDPRALAFGPLWRIPEENTDKDTSFRLDAEYKLQDNALLSSVEGGMRWQEREKETAIAEQHLAAWEIYINDYSLWWDAPVLHRDIATPFSPDNFMAGNAGSGVPTRWNAITDFDGAVAAYANQMNTTFGFEEGDPNYVTDYDSIYNVVGITPDRRGDADNSEETVAFYVQANIDAMDGKLTGNVGVRYVETELESSALVGSYYDATHGGELESLTLKKDYDNVLPSLNLSYQINDNSVIRFAAAEVMARPNFDDAKAGATVEKDGWMEEDGYLDGSNPGDNDRYTGGSVHLDPYEATQFDLSYEWYFEDNGMFSAGLFYKDISSYIYSQTTLGGIVEGYETETVTRQPFPTSDTSEEIRLPDGQQTAQAPLYFEQIIQPVNGDGGEIQGLELSYQQGFTFLPGLWGNFGIYANYTYTDSSADYFQDSFDNSSVDMPFLDQSEHAYNLMGYYEDDKLMVRLAYNWRDESLFLAASTDDTAIWRDEYGQLDASFSYQVTDALQIIGSASNLTEESDQYFSAPRSDGNLVAGDDVATDRNYNQTHTGRIYRLGVRMAF